MNQIVKYENEIKYTPLPFYMCSNTQLAIPLISLPFYYYNLINTTLNIIEKYNFYEYHQKPKKVNLLEI
jgi:hypothetical protein